MADKASIGIRQEQALNRLNAAASRLAERLGVDAPVIPMRGNDREMLRAQQLEAFAAWAEAIDQQMPEPDVVDEPLVENVDPGSLSPLEEVDEPMGAYDDMSKAELVIEMHERGLNVDAVVGTGANGNVLKDDLIAALEADDAGKGQADG